MGTIIISAVFFLLLFGGACALERVTKGAGALKFWEFLWPAGAVALYPAVWILLYGIYIAQVRAVAGHWPVCWEKVDESLFMGGQAMLLGFGFLVYPLIVLITFVASAIWLACSLKSTALILMLLVVVSVAGVLAAGSVIPSLDWFLDC